MCLGIEANIDSGVDYEETLSGALGFGLLQFSLSSSNGQMGILRPIVLLQSASALSIG